MGQVGEQFFLRVSNPNPFANKLAGDKGDDCFRNATKGKTEDGNAAKCMEEKERNVCVMQQEAKRETQPSVPDAVVTVFPLRLQ